MTDVIRVEGLGKISLFDLVDRLSGKEKKWRHKCCYDENILCVFLCSVVWPFAFPKKRKHTNVVCFQHPPPSKNVRLTTRGRTPHRHGFFLQLLKKGSNTEEKNTCLLNWGRFVTFQSQRIKDGHERKALETLNRYKGMTMATMVAIMMVTVTLMMTMAY